MNRLPNWLKCLGAKNQVDRPSVQTYMDKLQIALIDLQKSNTEIKELALDKVRTSKPDNAFKIIG